MSSVNKQLNSVLQIYTHSVTKSEFLQGNKFHFLDEINISNVDPARKAQIIFGDRTEHLIRSVPPGMRQFDLRYPQIFDGTVPVRPQLIDS